MPNSWCNVPREMAIFGQKSVIITSKSVILGISAINESLHAKFCREISRAKFFRERDFAGELARCFFRVDIFLPQMKYMYRVLLTDLL